MRELIASVLDEALSTLRERQIAIYTFALYFDHESPAVSACADTRENSAKTVLAINAYNRKYFVPAATSGDLKSAGLWCANIGRSMSLGNFLVRNLARRRVLATIDHRELCRLMLQSMIEREEEIGVLTKDRESLLLCCTGPDDESEYWWGLPAIEA